MITSNFFRPQRPQKLIHSRNLKGINKDALSLRSDLIQPQMIQNTPTDTDVLAEVYNETLRNLLDNLAPETTKQVPDRLYASWFTPEVKETKSSRRRAEHQWHRTGLEIHRQLYRQARDADTNLLVKAK